MRRRQAGALRRTPRELRLPTLPQAIAFLAQLLHPKQAVKPCSLWLFDSEPNTMDLHQNLLQVTSEHI